MTKLEKKIKELNYKKVAQYESYDLEKDIDVNRIVYSKKINQFPIVIVYEIETNSIFNIYIDAIYLFEIKEQKQLFDLQISLNEMRKDEDILKWMLQK